MKTSHFTRRNLLLAGVGTVAFLAGGVAMPALAKRMQRKELMQLAGQCLLVGFVGKTPSAIQAKALKTQMQQGYGAGVLFLRHNIGSAQNVKELCAFFKQGQKTVPLLAIDQEGGAVQRLSKAQGVEKYKRPLQVGQKMSLKEAEIYYSALAKQLKSFGFNFNLAPVIDLHDEANPAIGKWGRAFSQDPQKVADFAKSFIKAHHRHGLITSLKHFPGQGFAKGDTHDGLVNITKDWKEAELKPFKELIKAGYADTIMGGHLTHRSFESDGRPLIFSQKLIQKTLRKKMGFKGVVLTDDLDMGAIRKRYSLKQAVILAMQAGNDMLMLSNSLKPDPQLAEKAAGWIAKAVEDGQLSQSQLEASVKRVRALKRG